MTTPKTYLCAALSTGWLTPLSLSVNFYLNYLDYTVRPEIMGEGFKTPFPFLIACRMMFELTAFWLGCVIFAWAVFLLRKADRLH